MNNFRLIIAIGILFFSAAYFFATETGILPQRYFDELKIPQNIIINNCLDFNGETVTDTLTKFNNSKVFCFNDLIEFGPTIEFKYGKNFNEKKFKVYFEFDYLSKSITQEQTIVAQVINYNQESLFWYGIPISKLNTYDGQWSSIKTKMEIDLTKIDNLKNSVIKLYVWNKSKSNFCMDNFCVKIGKDD